MQQRRHPNQMLKGPHDMTTLHFEYIDKTRQQFFKDLYDSNHFQNAQSEREQVFITIEDLAEHNHTVSYNEIAKFFGINRGIVHRHYHNWKKNPNLDSKLGRPNIFRGNHQAEQFTIDTIETRYNENDPVTFEELKELLFINFNLKLNPRSLYAYISNNPDIHSKIFYKKKMKTSQMEEDFDKASDKSIYQYIENLQE